MLFTVYVFLPPPPVKFGAMQYHPNEKGTTEQKQWSEEFKKLYESEPVKDSVKALEELNYNFLVEQGVKQDKFFVTTGKYGFPIWEEVSSGRTPGSAMCTLLAEALKQVIDDLKGWKDLCKTASTERSELKKQLEECESELRTTRTYHQGTIEELQETKEKLNYFKIKYGDVKSELDALKKQK